MPNVRTPLLAQAAVALLAIGLVAATAALNWIDDDPRGGDATSAILDRARHLDTELNTLVARTSGFQLVHYDGFTALVQRLRRLEGDLRRTARPDHRTDGTLESGIEHLVESLDAKRRHAERVATYSSTIVNSLRYLGTATDRVAAGLGPDQARLLTSLLTSTLRLQVLPDEADAARRLADRVRRLRASGNLSADVDVLLQHADVTFKARRALNIEMAAFESVGTTTLLSDLAARHAAAYLSRARKLGQDKLILMAVVGLLVLAILGTFQRLRRRHAQAAQARQSLRAVLDTMPAAVALFDSDDRLMLRNDKLAAFCNTIGERIAQGIHFDSMIRLAAESGAFAVPREELPRFVDKVIALSREADSEVHLPMADGRHLLKRSDRMDDGRMIRVLFDVTRTKRIEAELRTLSQAVEQSPVSIVITDADGHIEYCNPHFTEVTGYTLDEVVGRNPRIFRSGFSSNADYERMWRTITSGREWRGDFHNRTKSGALIWEKAVVAPVRDDSGRIAHFMSVREDITARKQQEALLYRQAKYDPLTDLPNRSMALESLHALIALAHRSGRRVALMIIDLDDFKTVNEARGHAAGDALLQQVGKRIARCARDSDLVARLGGDEFAVVLPELEGRQEARGLAERIMGRFTEPFAIDGPGVSVTLSIGIAVYPDDGGEPHILMRNADSAMYRVKDTGRNNYAFFSEKLESIRRYRREVESELAGAVERGEIRVHYQPLIDLATDSVIGAEALCRWTNPSLGEVPPDTFIPLAEDRGLIVPIGREILRRACADAARWRRQTSGFRHISINVSPRQLEAKAGFPELVKRALDETGLPAGALTLEITESLLIDNFAGSVESLSRLRDMGVGIAIDDFGTGYSSFAYLKRFKFSALKIDRSFVRDLTDNQDNLTLVHSLINLARALDLQVVTEGIETEKQRRHLVRFEARIGQGFLFCRPLPNHEFTAYLLERAAVAEGQCLG